MQARIYRPTKNVMQSGDNNNWILEFTSVPGKTSYIENTLNRIASDDMLSTEVQLKFSSQEEATRFAIKNNYSYELIKPKSRKLIKKNYASNFK